MTRKETVRLRGRRVGGNPVTSTKMDLWNKLNKVLSLAQVSAEGPPLQTVWGRLRSMACESQLLSARPSGLVMNRNQLLRLCMVRDISAIEHILRSNSISIEVVGILIQLTLKSSDL